jgi:hypothetical protein
MKTLLAMIVLSVLAVPALGQPAVGVYTNAAGSGDCNLTEALFTVQSVWVVHQGGANAKAWRLRVSQNWSNATYIAPVYPILYINPPDVFGGDTFFGTGCVSAPYPFIQLQFMPMSAAPPCTVELRVLPDPGTASGQVEVIDCGDNTLYARSPAPYVSVNGGAACPCLGPVATDPSTWSKVKSQYR